MCQKEVHTDAPPPAPYNGLTCSMLRKYTLRRLRCAAVSDMEWPTGTGWLANAGSTQANLCFLSTGASKAVFWTQCVHTKARGRAACAGSLRQTYLMWPYVQEFQHITSCVCLKKCSSAYAGNLVVYAQVQAMVKQRLPFREIGRWQLTGWHVQGHAHSSCLLPVWLDTKNTHHINIKVRKKNVRREGRLIGNITWERRAVVRTKEMKRWQFIKCK